LATVLTPTPDFSASLSFFFPAIFTLLRFLLTARITVREQSSTVHPTTTCGQCSERVQPAHVAVNRKLFHAFPRQAFINSTNSVNSVNSVNSINSASPQQESCGQNHH
jgi:hypothetical protein